MTSKSWSPADLGDKAFWYDVNKGYRAGDEWRVLNEARGPITPERIEADKVTPESDAKVFPIGVICTDDEGRRYAAFDGIDDFYQASMPPSRIDTIGHNGGDGAHYDDPLYWRKRAENAEACAREMAEALQKTIALIEGEGNLGGLVWCMDGYYSDCFPTLDADMTFAHTTLAKFRGQP